MNRALRSWVAVFAGVLLGLSAFAQAPQPPEIAARSYLLVDITASQELASRDADAPVEPASLTKLMSAYLVFDALRAGKITLKQTLPVSPRASKMAGSRMFIDPGMQVPVEDLIKGMIVQSGNDATVALAEGVGGTVERFVQLMNDQAKALGMTRTVFRNPEGLPEAGQTTSARDLSILATRLLNDFPGDVGFYSIKKYRYDGTPTANDTNRNLLLFRDPTVDGLTAGYAQTQGYGLVATAKRDFPNVRARRLLVVVLGAVSESARANEAQKLLNWGYTAFEAIQLFSANQPIVTPEVWKGTKKTAKLGRTQAVVVAVPSGSASRVKAQVARPDPLIAPLGKGQQVGMLKISSGEELIVEVPLVALETVNQAGFLSRAWDAIRLWIK